MADDMRSYKFGNAFSDQRKAADADHAVTNPDQQQQGSAQADSIARDNTIQDVPDTPNTSFDLLVGPPTETEQRGRSLVRDQRDKMVASLSPVKSSRKRSDTDTSNTSNATKPEKQPAQNLLRRIKNKLGSKMSKANLREPAATSANINKPLPSIATSATMHPIDPAYAGIPNFLTMPSPSPRYMLPPDEQPEYPVPPAATATNDWPLPASSSPMSAPQIVPQVPTMATSATSTATLPSGIIFANSGARLLTPARGGTYTSVQRPLVVAPAGPTMVSMQASLVESAALATETQVKAVIEEGEGEDEGESQEQGNEAAAAVTVGEMRGELSALFSALDARLGRIEDRLAGLEGAVGRMESMVREERAQLKHQNSFGGRYPGDAKDMLAFK